MNEMHVLNAWWHVCPTLPSGLRGRYPWLTRRTIPHTNPVSYTHLLVMAAHAQPFRGNVFISIGFHRAVHVVAGEVERLERDVYKRQIQIQPPPAANSGNFLKVLPGINGAQFGWRGNINHPGLRHMLTGLVIPVGMPRLDVYKRQTMRS